MKTTSEAAFETAANADKAVLIQANAGAILLGVAAIRTISTVGAGSRVTWRDTSSTDVSETPAMLAAAANA